MKLDYQAEHRFAFSIRKNLDYHMHAQGEVEIGFMLHGSCKITCGNTVDTVREGDVFFMFPNQPHAYEESTDVQAYLLIVPVKRYLSAYGNILMKQTPVNPILRKGQWDESLLWQVERAYEDLGIVSETVMHGYLTVIFGKLLASIQLQEQRTGTDEILRRMLEYINEHYRLGVTRQEIAKAVGYNESYVSHLFSQTMGITMPEYIHSLRIEDGCRMLLETDRPVSQIASELGYGSIRNFNRVFYKRTGLTPRQYRNQAIK